MLSKFLNIKTLILILALLGIILLLVNLNKKEDRTFRSHLVEIDTARITKMVIIPKSGSGPEIIITKNGDEWHLESEGKSYMPDITALKNILVELTRMQTERVAATSKSQWSEFEVTDSTATRLKVFGGKKLLSDIYLGKFSYSQPSDMQNPNQRPQTRMFTHVRLSGEETVYVVEGFIKMNIQPNLDNYRAKVLCAAQVDDITRVSFRLPDDQFTLSFENGHWSVDGQPADSGMTVRYLQKLVRLTSSSFVNDKNFLSASPTHMIRIEGNNMFPVELKAYPADPENEYIITSSLVPDAQYSGSKAQLFERTFVGKEAFFPDES